MVKYSKSELLKDILSDGSKRAKEVVQAFKERNISESTAFYWLNKLRKNGEIRKVGSKYGLISMEEADEDEMEFLCGRLEEGSPEIKKTAAEDLRIICDEKKVSHLYWTWFFIDRGMGEIYGSEVREKAIQALRSVVRSSLMLNDEEVIGRIRNEFQEKLKEAVLEENLSFASRDAAAEVLDKILGGKENFQVLWNILNGLVKSGQMPVGLTVWRMLLDRHFGGRRVEIREKLYSLLESEDRSVRESVLLLFDELRARERRFV